MRLSRFDPLTGLYNRKHFFAAMEREVRRAARMGRGFGVLMLDLDDLKPVNDTFGHQYGDRLLRNVTEVIARTVRATDTAARYGGDEFVVLLPETDPEGAYVVAEKLRRDMAGMAIRVDERSVRTSVSVGLVSYPEDGQTVEQLISVVDAAMYEAKRRGKNQIVGYTTRTERVPRPWVAIVPARPVATGRGAAHPGAAHPGAAHGDIATEAPTRDRAARPRRVASPPHHRRPLPAPPSPRRGSEGRSAARPRASSRSSDPRPATPRRRGRRAPSRPPRTAPPRARAPQREYVALPIGEDEPDIDLPAESAPPSDPTPRQKTDRPPPARSARHQVRRRRCRVRVDARPHRERRRLRDARHPRRHHPAGRGPGRQLGAHLPVGHLQRRRRRRAGRHPLRPPPWLRLLALRQPHRHGHVGRLRGAGGRRGRLLLRVGHGRHPRHARLAAQRRRPARLHARGLRQHARPDEQRAGPVRRGRRLRRRHRRRGGRGRADAGHPGALPRDHLQPDPGGRGPGATGRAGASPGRHRRRRQHLRVALPVPAARAGRGPGGRVVHQVDRRPFGRGGRRGRRQRRAGERRSARSRSRRAESWRRSRVPGAARHGDAARAHGPALRDRAGAGALPRGAAGGPSRRLPGPAQPSAGGRGAAAAARRRRHARLRPR